MKDISLYRARDAELRLLVTALGAELVRGEVDFDFVFALARAGRLALPELSFR